MDLFKAQVPGFPDSPWLVKRGREPLGVYGAASAAQAILASAQNGTATGAAWMYVPTGTAAAARIRRLSLKFNTSAATPTCPTLPRIVLSRFTYEGTAAGAQLAAMKLGSYPVPVLDIRTAVTGLTPTLVSSGAAVAQGVTPPFLLAGTAADIVLCQSDVQHLVGTNAPEDEWIVIPAGEGLVLWQADNGTTSDIRKFFFDLVWDEIAAG